MGYRFIRMRVNTLEQLEQAAEFRWAVFTPKLHILAKPKPARFVMNMSGTIILRMIKYGLFVYKKENRHGER